jgi:inorganic pyrophosphatase
VEALSILKERRVDRMIREKQEELKDPLTEESMINVLTDIQHLNGIKKELSKQTGRVVVG